MIKPAAVVALALCSSGCFIEWTAGAYRTSHENGDSGTSYSIAVALGVYLDSYKAPVAVSYSGTYDAARTTTGNLTGYKNRDQQVRVDYTIGNRQPLKFQPGIVGAVRWGDDSTVTFGETGNFRSLSSQYTMFAGFAYRFLMQHGYAWNDAIVATVGPAYQHFDTVLAGEFSNTGVQVRLGAQFSPITILSMAPSDFMKNWYPSETSAPTDSCAGGYPLDTCDVDGNCRSTWHCP